MRLALVALVVSTAAFAQDAKVAVKADVILCQLKEGTVEAGLEAMQTKLAQGKKYGTLKRLSSQKLQLQAAPTPVALPNGKSADVSLINVEKDVAMIKVKTVQSEATLKLGRDGSLYQQAGEWQGGDLWLVLSQPK